LKLGIALTKSPRRIKSEEVSTPQLFEPEAGALSVEASEQEYYDDLLSCLRYLATLYERPSSDTALTAGLPLENGRLNIALFEAAAGRVGLSVKVLKRPLGQLIPFYLPAVLLTDAGRAAVLIERPSPEKCLAFTPDTGAVSELSYADLERNYSGLALAVTPLYSRADVDPSKPQAIRKAHWFFGPLLENWRSFVSVALAALMVNLVGVLTPLFALNVYDRVLPNKATSTLWVLALGFGVALIFDLILKTTRSLLLDAMGKELDVRLSGAIFEKVLNTSLVARSNSTGEFVNRISQYEFIREFFTSSTIVLFIDTSFIFIYLLVIYAISGWIVLVPLACMLSVLLIGIFLQVLVSDQLAKSETESSLRHAMLIEAVAAVETIKTMRAEGQFLRRWERLIRVASATQERIKALSSAGVNVALFFQQFVTVGVIVAGAYRFADGELTTGAIIATVMLSSRAVAPFTQIALTMTRARYAITAVKTLNTVMSLPDERVATESFVARNVERGKLELRRVVFQYPRSTLRVLDRVDLTIDSGEKVGVIGKVGSGKTTLARLIGGIYAPVEGEILLDGVDMRQYHPHDIRKAVGLVMQDTDLFIGSIKANVLLARPNASDEELIQACKLSGVDDFVSHHPLGYDLPVGERGRNLSTGQRQAVALARTFLARPKILFLDEPSSAMDLATERAFLKRLAGSMTPDQTLIIATHRYSMLALVKRLIVIDSGRIIADGEKEQILDALRKQASSNQ